MSVDDVSVVPGAAASRPQLTTKRSKRRKIEKKHIIVFADPRRIAGFSCPATSTVDYDAYVSLPTTYREVGAHRVVLKKKFLIFFYLHVFDGDDSILIKFCEIPINNASKSFFTSIQLIACSATLSFSFVVKKIKKFRGRFRFCRLYATFNLKNRRNTVVPCSQSIPICEVAETYGSSVKKSIVMFVFHFILRKEQKNTGC